MKAAEATAVAGPEGAAELRLSQGLPSVAGAAGAADATAEVGGVNATAKPSLASEENRAIAAAAAAASGDDDSLLDSTPLDTSTGTKEMAEETGDPEKKAAEAMAAAPVGPEGAAELRLSQGVPSAAAAADPTTEVGGVKTTAKTSSADPTAEVGSVKTTAKPSSASEENRAAGAAAVGDNIDVEVGAMVDGTIVQAAPSSAAAHQAKSDFESESPLPHPDLTLSPPRRPDLARHAHAATAAVAPALRQPGAFRVEGPNMGGATGEAPALEPGAFRIPGSATQPNVIYNSNRHSVGNDNDAFVDDNAEATDTAMTAMTTATLVQDGAVADATAVDVEAERAEQERMQREIDELRRRMRVAKADQGSSSSGNNETKEGATLPWSGKSSRQCRIYAAVAVVCAVALAGIVGGVLGARGQSEGGSNGSSSSSSDAFNGSKDNSSPGTGMENSSADATASARLEAMKAIVVPLSEEDAFDDEEGPHFAALDWIANVDAAQLPADDPEIEWRVRQRYILALFYFSTGGDDWDEGFDFLSDDNECKWLELRNNDLATSADTVYPKGTFCDNKGRVERISLWWNNLSGTLPHELSNLDRLTKINLPGNNLSGPIPSKFGQLTNLKQLFLNENCLSGTVPKSLSELPNLEMAELVGNKDLTGSLNGFCNGTEYKGNLFHFTANCGTCPNSPSLVQCDCCVCCDLVTYNCCDKEGNRLWNHANIGLNAAGQPSSFDKPCLSKDTLAYYLDHKDDLLWITDGRGGGWI